MHWIHLLDNGFNYLSQVFTGEQLKLVKQKDSSENFSEDKLPDRGKFLAL